MPIMESRSWGGGTFCCGEQLKRQTVEGLKEDALHPNDPTNDMNALFSCNEID